MFGFSHIAAAIKEAREDGRYEERMFYTSPSPDNFRLLSNKFLRKLRKNENRKAVIEQYVPQLLPMIKRLYVEQLVDLLDAADDQSDFLLTWLRPHLSDDLRGELGEHRNDIVELLHRDLRDILKTANDFETVLLHCGHAPARQFLIILYRSHLPNIIKTAQDFWTIARWLHPWEIKTFLKMFKQTLPNIIKTKKDFCFVIGPLDYKEYPVVWKMLPPSIHKMVKNNLDKITQHMENPAAKQMLHDLTSSMQLTISDVLSPAPYLPGYEAAIARVEPPVAASNKEKEKQEKLSMSH